jgi:hypothetical protein
MMININVAIADTEPVGAGPSDGLQVFFLKKTFDFCDDGLGSTGYINDMPGGSVPDGMDVQTAGCVDRWISEYPGYPHVQQDRQDNYAFTGEQIGELVVARDLDGSIAISHAMMQVDGVDVAFCNEISIQSICGEGATYPYAGCVWRDHGDATLSDLLNEYPAQISESTRAGFDPLYDKLFECILTTTDDMQGPMDLTVEVSDVVNDQVASTPVQTWWFNPAVSVSVTVSEGSAIEFEDGYAGDTVYSINKLLMENGAEGGVDIAIWLGGTDLTSPTSAAKCPWSNILDVEGITVHETVYNGMDFRCNLDNGLYVEQEWQDIRNKVIKDDCWRVSDGIGVVDDMEHCLSLNPLFYAHENVLENGHEADCSFKLQYPVPCIGDFTGGNLIILMRAI